MDNLTHSLVGALFGQMGLKRRTGMAMPTLIIAANIPDIDATCTVFGMQSLAMRRGITHGPIALLLLPVLLTGAMLLWDRWQRSKQSEGRVPVHAGWLLALAYVGCLSHPALDWLNNYGIRLLEPFSQRWFYGDTLFIIDPWLLLVLGLAVFLSLRLDRRGSFRWQWPAWGAAVLALGYIGLNYAISQRAVAAGREALLTTPYRNPRSEDVMVVANVPVLAFWKRNLLWRDRTEFGDGTYDARTGKAFFLQHDRDTCQSGPCAPPWWIVSRPVGIETWMYAHARNHPDVRAFLFWSRMPVAVPSREGYLLRDQRFMDSPAGRNFSVTLPR